MSTEMQVWFQANGSLLCLHSSDSTDVGGCKTHSVWPWHTLFTSPDTLSLKRSSFSPQRSGSPHPSIIPCLPLVTSSFSYAGSSVYLLNFEWKPNGQKLCTEFYICSLLSFHEYKTPAQKGESAGRDQHYPYLMRREPEFIDGKTTLDEDQVQ